MQAGGRLVKHVERACTRHVAEFGGKLDALRFTTGNRGACLPKLHVAKANIAQALKHAADLWVRFKVQYRVVHSHVQHFGNVLAFELHLKRFAVVPGALAGFACNEHVRQEVHFNLHHALTLACFAAAALDIETKATGLIAADL